VSRPQQKTKSPRNLPNLVNAKRSENSQHSHREFGRPPKDAEPIVVCPDSYEEGKLVKVPKHGLVFFEVPILSKNGSVLESEILNFKSSFYPSNNRSNGRTAVVLCHNDNIDIKCFKDKGFRLFKFEIGVYETYRTITLKTAANKRKL
jgi:hypothetical protein